MDGSSNDETARGRNDGTGVTHIQSSCRIHFSRHPYSVKAHQTFFLNGRDGHLYSSRCAIFTLRRFGFLLAAIRLFFRTIPRSLCWPCWPRTRVSISWLSLIHISEPT